MKDTLVSVIMPVFNSEKHLNKAINSVLNQTYSNLELLICDDSSTDKSLYIANKQASRDHRIRIIPNTHRKGAAGARNSCIERAQGRFISFLDSDDLWLPKKLETQLQHLKRSNANFALSYYLNINENGKNMGLIKAPAYLTLNKLKFSNFIGCLTALYDRLELGTIYQPDIRKRNDYALWLTIFRKKNIKPITIQEPLAKYRINNYGLSSNRKDSAKYFFLCLKKYANLNTAQSIFFLSIYLIIVLIKKKAPTTYNSTICSLFSTT